MVWIEVSFRIAVGHAGYSMNAEVCLPQYPAKDDQIVINGQALRVRAVHWYIQGYPTFVIGEYRYTGSLTDGDVIRAEIAESIASDVHCAVNR